MTRAEQIQRRIQRLQDLADHASRYFPEHVRVYARLKAQAILELEAHMKATRLLAEGV